MEYQKNRKVRRLSDTKPPSPALSPQIGLNRGGKSAIDNYGLAGYVREQRLKGKSYREITNAINDNHMLPNDYKIGYGAVANWCQNNGYDGNVKDTSEMEAINVYDREVKMLNAINTTMDIVMTKMDDVSKMVSLGKADVRELKTMVDMIDKMSVRQQALTQDIGRLQERIYNYQMVSDAFQIINDTLRQELAPDVYVKTMNAIASRPVLQEALRAIAPAGA